MSTSASDITRSVITRPSVITISANDSSGMAGLTRDIQTIIALGAHAKSVCTANTAQNTQGVISINPVSLQTLEDQLNSCFDGKEKAALTKPVIVKIGLLANIEQIQYIAHFFKQHQPNALLIIDPVFKASSGDVLQTQETRECFIKELLPLCHVLTPNMHEAIALSGKSLTTLEGITSIADTLCTMGAQHVLIKGGHTHDILEQDSTDIDSTNKENTDITTTRISDYFFSPQSQFWLSSEKIQAQNSRGTGCAFASALASALALGYSTEDACVIAKMAINQGLKQGYTLANNSHTPTQEITPGPNSITHFPKALEDLPAFHRAKDYVQPPHFPMPTLPNGEEEMLGLYPVVDSSEWIARLLPLGITTIQLRIKEGSQEFIESEVIKSIALAKEHNARLFINDYWELAIEHDAYGVHLGQEDLDSADIHALHRAGLRLGVSTHCHYEVARAHALRPSYIACGPVYHTNTKQMPWTPHGPEGFRYWRECLKQYPLVAIGGINEARIPAIASEGADSIAMITAITLAENPEATTQAFIKKLQEHSSYISV